MSHRLGTVTVSCPKLPPSQVLMGLCPHVWESVCPGWLCTASTQPGWVWGPFLGVGSSLCLGNQSVQTNSERGERQRINPTTLSKPLRLQS